MALNQLVMSAAARLVPRHAAGVDAMERDMGTTLATKQDLEMLRREMNHRFALVDQKIDTLELRMTVKLGSMMVVGFGLMIAALRLWA